MGYRMKFAKPAIATLLLLAAGAVSAAATTNSVSFTDAHAILATPTLGSGYVTMTSTQDDTLTGLSSPCCDAVELHSMSMKDDTMRMRKLDSLALKAGTPTIIGKDGSAMDSTHLMLIGLHQQLAVGQQFPITFHFANQTAQTASFTVTERSVKTPAGAAAHTQH